MCILQVISVRFSGFLFRVKCKKVPTVTRLYSYHVSYVRRPVIICVEIFMSRLITTLSGQQGTIQ